MWIPWGKGKLRHVDGRRGLLRSPALAAPLLLFPVLILSLAPFRSYAGKIEKRPADWPGVPQGGLGENKRKRRISERAKCVFWKTQALFLPVFTLLFSMVGAAALWSTLYIWVMRSSTLLE
jgi:hypothetical protein